MKLGPKYKICKRLGSGVFEQCQTQRFVLSDARRGKSIKRRRTPLSDYGKQLLEKQRMRYSYGLTEKQLARYVKKATSKTGNSVSRLLSIIESRLDNVVYRSGLASTRRFARQLVSHGHITVNGKKVTVPSYQVRENDVIAVREGSRKRIPFTQVSDEAEAKGLPHWLVFDSKKLEGKITARPEIESTNLFFNPNEVLEYYTR